jgi:hypothetical protein
MALRWFKIGLERYRYNKNLELHTIGGHPRKNFSGNDPLGLKIRIGHFRSEKTLSWFREGVLCIEAKSCKNVIFALKTTPFEVKNVGKSEFDTYKTPRIQEKLYIDAKIWKSSIFWSKNNAFSYIHIIVNQWFNPIKD